MTDKPKLPVSGGSWMRLPDGSLEPATKISTPPTTTTPSGVPVSTARKGPKKET